LLGVDGKKVFQDEGEISVMLWRDD